MLGDRRIEKADPDPALVAAAKPPTTYAPLVALQNQFIAKPLYANRSTKLELYDVEI